jgi:UDP-N-acetylglucosamine 2-epimerase
MLIEDHAISPSRIRIVGNHLHDRLPFLRADAIRQDMARLHPDFWRRAGDRRLILLATTIQREYAQWPDEQERYVRYLEHFYKSVDFSRAVVIVRTHPYDLRVNRNLYEELIPTPVRESVLVLSHQQAPDTYSMLRTADLVVTRCSTVAEEALLLGKKVVAFDLDKDGPSRNYHHLLQFGDYRAAYAEPFDTLGRTIRDALDADACPAAHRDVVAELTRSLDGHSMACTVEAILGELQAATADRATR